MTANKTRPNSQHPKPLCGMPQAHHKRTKDCYNGPAKGAPFCNPPTPQRNWGAPNPPPPPTKRFPPSLQGYALVWGCRKTSLASRVHKRWANACWEVGVERAASASWRPCHAGACTRFRRIFAKRVSNGGCGGDMYHRVMGGRALNVTNQPCIAGGRGGEIHLVVWIVSIESRQTVLHKLQTRGHALHRKGISASAFSMPNPVEPQDTRCV